MGNTQNTARKSFKVRDGYLLSTNPKTGEVHKLKLATDNQLDYIRSLEQQAGIPPRQYKNLTVWGANKVIQKLRKKTAQERLL